MASAPSDTTAAIHDRRSLGEAQRFRGCVLADMGRSNAAPVHDPAKDLDRLVQSIEVMKSTSLGFDFHLRLARASRDYLSLLSGEKTGTAVPWPHPINTEE
ncbi:MAG: hypothetical protein JO119_01535 [Acidobacteria bacterium]|nr:hypothetical protein [Acidobacteriota bacterium]